MIWVPVRSGRADSHSLAYAELRLILARIIFDFDMKLTGDSGDWIGRQKTFPLWARLPLNVYFTPVKRG